MQKKFYLTTAIDYPNGAPHIGHVYEKLVADCYARWYRFLGVDVRFLTGSDENGQKLVKAAKEQGFDNTKSFVDVNVEKFKKLFKDLEITDDDFIRTTEERHAKVCGELWATLEKKGDIYFDRYSGHYCLACEAFYVESQAEGLKCPQHGTALEFIEEDGYFFKLGVHKDWILSHIDANPEFIFPSSARKEIVARLQGDELRNLSISRPNAGWGIPVPSNPKHVIYTWFDALINYYAAVADEPLRSKYWPADMHVIGKDITWFHAVIWPCMLHAAGVPVPKQIHVHGMVLAEDGKKMSKSLGNVIDPYDILGKFPLDILRYYILRAISSGHDGSFSMTGLIERNNNELANDFGNLALRVIKLAAKRLGNKVDASGVTPDFDFEPLGKDMSESMDAREHNRALDKLWEQINKVNAYLNVHEPWRIKDDEAKFKQHIYNGLYAVHCFATLMEPFVPHAAAKTLKFLGSKNEGLAGLKFGAREFNIGETESLFPKIEVEKK
jgi:methionyl-tRNA synthetase